MKKYALQIHNLSEQAHYELILQGSKVATMYTPKNYCSIETEDDGMYEDPNMEDIVEFAQDLANSTVDYYKNEVFQVSYTNDFTKVVFIFYNGYVYSFDNYYTDCNIFKKVIQE
jgi:hypothetical protein